jgi:hypothetical protein
MNQHSFSLDELNDMMPWEREIYITLVRQHVEEENQRIKKENG